ncbi:uncharacterized protein LOC34622315 [Cyclospora cayetanensis]|uniref:Uncharacterized protein LOC34622315 n=1 Tax=Cyclospora cayetanensis TaxID=88456 RepID=A0A6P6RPM1_9EIME|nr:uncharacterized protein LOC34622315 [Cyclospora cayetanensis]
MSSISIIPDAAAEFDSLRKEPAEAMLKSLSAPAPPATVAGTRQSRPSAPNSDSEKKIDLPAIRAHPTPPRISEPVCETSQLPSSSRGREAVPTTTPAKYVELSAAETQPNAASGSKSDEAAAAAIHAAAVPTTPAGVAATSAAVAAAESKSHEAAVPPPSKSHEAAAAESKSHEAAVPPPSKSHEAAAAESKSHEATVPPPSKSHEAAAAESTSETASAPASGAAAVATRTMLPEASTAEELDASTPSAKAHVSPVTPDAAADAVPNMETQGKEANSSEQQPEEERESQKHLSMQDPLSLQRGFSHFMNLPKLHERNKGERGADDGTRRRSGSVVGEGEADSRYRPSSNGSTDTERKQEEGDATKRLADGLEDVVEYIQSDAEKVELVSGEDDASEIPQRDGTADAARTGEKGAETAAPLLSADAAASARPPEYSGFLWKKSPVALVGWQLRWFVLKDRRLLYYKQKGDVRPLGRLDLELIRIKVQCLWNPRQLHGGLVAMGASFLEPPSHLLDLLCCGGRLGSKAALSAGEEQPTRLRFRIKPLGSKRIFELAVGNSATHDTAHARAGSAQKTHKKHTKSTGACWYRVSLWRAQGHVNEVIEWIDNLRESYRGSHMKESSAAALVAGQKLFWKIERVSPSVFQDVSSTGDILLFRTLRFNAKMQRLITRGTYDHVGMVLRNRRGSIYILECMGDTGVILTPWSSFVRNQWFRVYQRCVFTKSSLGNHGLCNAFVLTGVRQRLVRRWPVLFFSARTVYTKWCNAQSLGNAVSLSVASCCFFRAVQAHVF